MNRILALALVAALIAVPAVDAYAQAAEKVKEAIRIKASGKTDEAVALYEATLEADKSALAEADGGLKEDLFAKYEKAAEAGDQAALLKLAQYYDMFGLADKAMEAYRKAAAGADPKIAAEAKAYLSSLQKETELAKPPASAPIAAVPNEGSPSPDGTEPAVETPPENGEAPPPPNADVDQKKNELSERIAALEAELATAEDDMLGKKRDWKKSDKGNYDGDARRRFRQAKEVYDGKAKEIEDLKQQLKDLDSGASAPPPEPAAEETPTDSSNDAPNDAPPEEEGGEY